MPRRPLPILFPLVLLLAPCVMPLQVAANSEAEIRQIEAELEKLAELKQKGIITEAEFQKLKSELLKKL